jgi:glycosyltransferase involved in cell wall biosynthesis
MEAMALKVPVVASDIPGNRLLVTHNETGLLFPVGACQNLADAISFIMDNPDEAKNMAESGCLKVEENYSNRIMAREYGVIYESLK